MTSKENPLFFTRSKSHVLKMAFSLPFCLGQQKGIIAKIARFV